jgi:hypothetical protein
MNGWDDEEKFKKDFFSLNNPDKELKILAEWRKYQIKIVSKIIDQIKLLASEHYTDIDHFLLELLQNADDNTYDEDVQPTVWITLDNDFFRLENNEKGFTPQDLFAITYSAASTKTRQKTGATFIGEKGIGFKSVFAVADYVDIHSPPYHFRLNNDEFIIPRPIPSQKVSGTRILLRLREGNTKIPNILSERLTSLCKNAQEFVLFLQKIQRLHVDDHISSSQRNVIAERDNENNFYMVESEGQERTYFTHRYKVRIPHEVVRTRFNEFDEDLEREIIMAVPYPGPDRKQVEGNGRLFCFLPTGVKTGTPIHLQIDAKTVANRENLVDFAGSDWNRAVFQSLEGEFVKMFLKLREKPIFAERLPEYLPWNVENQDLKNKDFHEIMLRVKDQLQTEPIVRDRHEEYMPGEFVKRVPEEFEKIFYEPKYERALSRYLVERGDYENWEFTAVAEEAVTLVDPMWAKKYPEEILSLGVEKIDSESCLRMLREGPPQTVNINDEKAVRNFLDKIMWLADSIQYEVFSNPNRFAIEDLKECPIFPLHDGKTAKWGILNHDVMWIRTDSPENKGTVRALLVDPTYTYSPGGSSTKEGDIEGVRKFNSRFRNFLLEVCEIDFYTVVEYLRRTVIKKLIDSQIEPNNETQRKSINEAWFQLYQKIWNRKATIIKKEEGGEENWKKIFAELGECEIPIRRAGEKNWSLGKVKLAFIGPRFKTQDDLAKVYKGTGAPIIDLDFLENIAKRRQAKRQRKVDWDDWRKFLLECGAKEGPHIVNCDLSNNNAYNRSSGTAYQNSDNKFALSVLDVLRSHNEYKYENTTRFYLTSGSQSYCLDGYTKDRLSKRQPTDFLARRLGFIWDSRINYQTTIRFLWGQKRDYRAVTTKLILLEEELREPLVVRSDKGLKVTTECFEENTVNKLVLGNLVPYVNCERFRYNRELLEYAGMIFSVKPDDVSHIIERWYEGTPSEQRSTKAFELYLEVVARFCRYLPQYSSQCISSLKLYQGTEDRLIPFLLWKKSASGEYPASLVERVIEAIEPDAQVSLDSALGAVLACNPLESHTEGLAEALVRLGRFCEANSIDGVREAFEMKLAKGKLKGFGKWIKNLTLLPILWDLPTSPLNPKDMLVIHAYHSNEEFFQVAVDVLGWPCMSRLAASPQVRGGESELDENTVRRIYYVFKELIQGFEKTQPQVRRRIEDLGLFSSVTVVGQKIKRADAISIIVQKNGAKNEYSVPYWFNGESLLIGQDQDLTRTLPQFIDLYCGTTFSPSFRYMWNDKDLISRVEIGKGGGPEQSPPDHPRPGNQQGDLSSLEDQDIETRLDIGLDDEGDAEASSEDGTASPDSGKGSSGKKEVRKRSRLCSLVISRKSRQTDETNKEAQARNKEVEAAGRKRMLDYFNKLGVECKSVEQEDKGYDFEISIGEETFFVELKASEDRWDGWEESLSRNEFWKAKELGEKYFLCVVDKALSEDWKIHFIRNPAGEVDYYLFDHPWKGFATDMNAYVSRLKAEYGILEE